MGRPDDLEDFVRFDAHDIAVYVSQELLDRQKPGTRRLPFHVDGYGRFWLKLEEPRRGTE